MTYDSSVRRAAGLLGVPSSASFVILKLDEGGVCHCFHCWPETWAAVNEYLGGQGPIQDEGDLLVHSQEADFVLECHESGPEIVFLVAAGVSLLKDVVGIVTKIVVARRREKPQVRPLKLTIVRSERGVMDVETVVELELPVSREPEELIAKLVQAAVSDTPNKSVQSDALRAPLTD